MGVISSTPVPIKIQIKDIEYAKEEYILDSVNFSQDLKWLSKACTAVSKNKKVSKAVFKLFLYECHNEKLGKGVALALNTKKSFALYGSGLEFLKSNKWTSIWQSARIQSLSIKLDLPEEAFQNLAKGLETNHTIKTLTFKYLNFSHIQMLARALKVNKTVQELNILFDQRPMRVNQEDDHLSVSSYAASTAHSSVGQVQLLSQNTSVTTYRLAGYLESYTPMLLIGLVSNQHVKCLKLETLDLDRDANSFWSQALGANNSIKEIQTHRGLNTLTSMIVFTCLKKNTTVQKLTLNESTFYEGGFIVLKSLLETNNSLKELELNDMLYLGRSSLEVEVQSKNISGLLGGLEVNTSLERLQISLHPSVLSTEIPGIFQSPQVRSSVHSCLLNNITLKSLEIVNYKLSGEEIEAIAEGLKQNKSVEKLDLRGNLMGWNELELLVTSVVQNSVLKCLDVSSNKILKFQEVSKLRGTEAQLEAVGCAQNVFSHYKQTTIKELQVNDWFWEIRQYPKDLHELVLQAKQHRKSL